MSSHATPREHYAAEHLRAAIAKLGGSERILLAVEHDPLFASFGKDVPELWPGAKEAFVLKRLGNTIVVEGADPSGVLYGTEELIGRIHAAGTLPEQLDFEDHPQLRIRGAVIGLQKPEITYEGAEYDYPYTPKDFPVVLRQGASGRSISINSPSSAPTRSSSGTDIHSRRC